MPQTFVVAFGGTGARCLESLLYLSAAGVVPGRLLALVVDPDHTNGNVADLLAQSQRYSRLTRTLGDPVKGHSSPFFQEAIDDGDMEGVYAWEYPNRDSPFSDRLKLDSGAPGVFDLLYDEDDCDLVFDEGYVARAHIGSFDLFRTIRNALEEARVGALANLKDGAPQTGRDLPADGENDGGAGGKALSRFIRELLGAVNSERPNLVVLGSLFGGTGASGMPAFAALVEELIGEYRENINLICVPLAPYFRFAPPQKGSNNPNSVEHPMATRAALSHYASVDVGFDRYYYIGAPKRHATNSENVRGGPVQRNTAHYVELAAALAIVDVAAHPIESGERATVGACRVETLDWTALPAAEVLRTRKRLAALSTFALYHTRFSGPMVSRREHVVAKWAVDLQAVTGRELEPTSREFVDLTQFCERFLTWARQIETSLNGDEPSIASFFTIPKDPSKAAPGDLSRLVPGGGDDDDPYHTITKVLDQSREAIRRRDPVGWYVAALSDAAETYCSNNYPWWVSQ